jgi:hypothetical protein
MHQLAQWMTKLAGCLQWLQRSRGWLRTRRDPAVRQYVARVIDLAGYRLPVCTGTFFCG